MIKMIYIVIILSAVIVILLLHRPTKEKVKRVGNSAVGVCASALERSGQKQARKAKILEPLQESGELGNEEIREVLRVSRNTVIRYMNELEAEGAVEQVGTTGRGVVYRLK